MLVIEEPENAFFKINLVLSFILHSVADGSATFTSAKYLFAAFPI